jgi:hypothetical protein
MKYLFEYRLARFSKLLSIRYYWLDIGAGSRGFSS